MKGPVWACLGRKRVNLIQHMFRLPGSVFHVDDKGHSTSSFAVDGRVKTLLYYEGKDVLVTVTENMMLTQHTIEPDGTTNEIMKVEIVLFGENVYVWYVISYNKCFNNLY